MQETCSSEDDIAGGRGGVSWGGADGGVVSERKERGGATDGEGGEGSRRCQEGEETQRGWLILH